MISQMVLINKMSKASPNFRVLGKMFKHVQLRLPSKLRLAFLAAYDFAKQTGVNLMLFYIYNIIQIPVFIIMIFSIRKICFEHGDLAGQGALWFKDLN